MRPIQFPTPKGYSPIHVYRNDELKKFIVIAELGRSVMMCDWDGVSDKVENIVPFKLHI